jgi:general secretion pathway protein E
MGVEPFLISSSLEGVLAQRLVRTLCAHCKEAAPLSAETIFKLKTFGVDPGSGLWFRGKGCEACRNTGYRGRTGLFELLVMRPDLREMITAKRPSTEIKAAASKVTIPIREDGLRKAAAGITTLDEVLRVALGEGASQ